MNWWNIRKSVHFASTGWFAVCAGYLLIFGLVQSGRSWWVILPLSGYSVLLTFLLVSLYLFVIFRGVARSQKVEIEHPLTTCVYYLFFYDISPFLGALSGGIAAIGSGNITDYLFTTATGSLWVTFLVWIIVDPLVELFEMLLPGSRKHRGKRLAEIRAVHKQQQSARERLLAEVEADERYKHSRWYEVLQPFAERLAVLVDNGMVTDTSESKAVDMGVHAWRLGGIECMQQLHSMAMEICMKKRKNTNIVDYLSLWWDGIGSWRSCWLNGESVPEANRKGFLCKV